jgi:hypothetical protein
MEKTSTGFCWGSRAVISLEVTMTVSAGGPIFCFVVLLKSLIDKSLTGEPILPSRTADKYLANIWPDIGPRFATARYWPDIGPRFATVKLVHRSEIYHKSSPSADRTPEGEIDGSPVIEPQKWGPMETGRATPGDHPRDRAGKNAPRRCKAPREDLLARQARQKCVGKIGCSWAACALPR